ncbi:MAG: hypothetical protein IPK80_24225 [Nannocystis sp.]|nr:hypothetical protein [Nannocystis sp.]
MRQIQVALAVLSFVAISTASTAALAVPKELRPGTKPHYFEFGPNVGYGFYGPRGALGGAWLDYMYHFQGGAEGPALGVLTLFGGWNRYFSFSVGPMFQWDFKLVKSKPLGLYLGPHVSTGYSFFSWRGVGDHSFYAMVGPTVKLIVNDFWCFWARPLNFDLRWYGRVDGNFGAALGAGITF